MSTMQDLAQSISFNVAALSKVLKESNLVEPTVGHQEAEFPQLNKEGESVRNELLSAISQLERIVVGPFQYLVDLTHQTFDVGILRTLTHFNIPRLVPAKESISYLQLSKLSGLREDILRHYIREVICTMGFLAEDSAGNVCHSAASLVWHVNTDLADTHEFDVDHKFPAAVAEAEARAQDPQGTNGLICGYSQAFKATSDGYEPFYKHVMRSPEQGRKFSNMMRMASTRGGVKEILKLYDWSTMHGKTLVDVGGSTGHTAAVIAEAHPEIRIVVQDLPEVIQRATAAGTPQMPPNITFQAYNFFTPQPVTNADAYLFRSCFHNWPDASARKIAENLVPALRNRPGTKVFVVERIMPALGSGNLYQEKQARQLDANMSILMNGRCREVEELKEMLASADPKLKFKGVNWAGIATITDPRSHSFLEWEYE